MRFSSFFFLIKNRDNIAFIDQATPSGSQLGVKDLWREGLNAQDRRSIYALQRPYRSFLFRSVTPTWTSLRDVSETGSSAKYESYITRHARQDGSLCQLLPPFCVSRRMTPFTGRHVAFPGASQEKAEMHARNFEERRMRKKTISLRGHAAD
jgi:hypothetical protein